MAQNHFIPFARPWIGDDEIEAVSEVLTSKWISTGPKTAEFERQFAEYIGVKHALAVSSCTAALHLSLVAAGIDEGDEGDYHAVYIHGDFGSHRLYRCKAGLC